MKQEWFQKFHMGSFFWVWKTDKTTPHSLSHIVTKWFKMQTIGFTFHSPRVWLFEGYFPFLELEEEFSD